MARILKMVNAMALVPTSITHEEQKYITTAGRIKFKAGQTGLISFIFPFPTLQKREVKKGGVGITLRYARDLNAEGASVKAELRRYGLFGSPNGNVATVMEVDSDNQSPQGPSGSENSFASISTSRAEILDTSQYGYYFQVTLKRNRIQFDIPDDVGGGTPTELNVAILDFRIEVTNI